jgi:hypothetical protein
MHLYTRVGIAGLVAALAGATANAGLFDNNIYMTFSDPAGQREVRYIQPADATQLGNLTYNTTIPINLQFDLSDFGLGSFSIVSCLAMDVDVGPASPGAQVGEFLARASGDFVYRRKSDNAVLITGDFTDASMSILRTSGGVTANGLMNMGQFNVSFSPTMLAEFLGHGFAFPGFDGTRFGDASWTLTGVTPNISLITPPGSAEQFFANFNSNAAFTSTIPVLPTPGTIGLAMAAGVVTLRRRRN